MCFFRETYPFLIPFDLVLPSSYFVHLILKFLFNYSNPEINAITSNTYQATDALKVLPNFMVIIDIKQYLQLAYQIVFSTDNHYHSQLKMKLRSVRHTFDSWLYCTLLQVVYWWWFALVQSFHSELIKLCVYI